jgi:hypothetical protein
MFACDTMCQLPSNSSLRSVSALYANNNAYQRIRSA